MDSEQPNEEKEIEEEKQEQEETSLPVNASFIQQGWMNLPSRNTSWI